MVDILSCVGTTASEMSTPPVGLRYFPWGNPGRTQSPPPLPMLCGGYPPPKTGGRYLSGRVPLSGCDPDVGDGMHAHILSARTLQTPTGVCVHG